ncbi:MAG: thioredoxin domain-containing protein [Planctomycetota bacterium]|nr:thioredoxin domain-containing protein [Planctomycetota bacterium]MDI6788790.1 thioredoxin domain-containing protein [Planctomycetota bacterium]
MDLENISDNPKLILALFKSEWCHSCDRVLPEIKEVSLKYPDKIDFREIDISKQPEVSTKYEILSIPTLLVIKNGQVIERVTGFISKDNLVKKLNL